MAVDVGAAPVDGPPDHPEEPARAVAAVSTGRSLRARLGVGDWPGTTADRVLGWLGPLVVTALALWLRLDHLRRPLLMQGADGKPTYFFDEVYYPRDAQALLQYGVEHQPPGSGDFVVHPPLGKWAIALGEQLVGYDTLGWRAPSAVAGALMVLVFARLTRRVTRSWLLGTLGGLLLSLDGLQFVQSRIGTLDVFLAFWITAALACLVADRDQGRVRLARQLAAGAGGAAGTSGTGWTADGPGPRLGIRWWRVATGFCLGCAGATKWSVLALVVAFPALALAWDVGARRVAGSDRPVLAVLRKDLPLAAGSFVLVPFVVYLVSWTGWFASDVGYDRHKDGRSGVVGSVENLASYHREAYCFHQGLTNDPVPHDEPFPCSDRKSSPSTHPYESKPFGWLVLARPVAYAYDGVKNGESIDEVPCRTSDPNGCSREVLAVNTPLLWWPALAAVVACVGLWAARRDWRAALVVVGFAAYFLPWLQNTQRVMFQFYALPLLPFAVLGLVLVLGRLLGSPSAPEWRRTAGAVAVGVVTLLVLADFAWLHPVLAGDLIPYSAWHRRVVEVLGFPGWV